MEWISVKERLPEENKFVLVLQKEEGYFSFSAPRIWIAQRFGNNKWDCGEYRIEEVTHWMPLPEQPKEKE